MARTREALRQIEEVIAAHYVFADLRAPVVEALRSGASECRYDVSDPSQFAALVTEDLRRISQDGHLYLLSDPGQYTALLAPPASDQGIDAFRRAQAVRTNHGLTEMKVLSENIRYLRIEAFRWVPDGSTVEAYDAAAAFLAGGDAVVIDLRGNGGGESDAADYFLEHVIPPVSPVGGDTRKPVFILIDGFVGSAAEAVTYDAKLRGAAVIVGANSFGAANNSKRFPISPGLVLSVSYNRPIHPLSGTNWEGTGVSPDLAVAPALALEAAEAAAIAELDARAPAESPLKPRYAWRLVWLQSRLQPPTVTAERLATLEGRYGPIELRYESEELRLYRADRPRWPQGARLSALTDDGVFSLEGTDDLRVLITPSELAILRPGTESETYPASR